MIGDQPELLFADPLRGLAVALADTEVLREIADRAVRDYHGYVSTPQVVGRCLKYLIRLDGELVGTFWLGSGFKPTPKAVLSYFKLSQQQFDLIFNEIADNKRFSMVRSIPNLGSQVLRRIRERARSDWRTVYGDNLRAIITTIGGGKTGAVYRADNWKYIGETAGLPAQREAVSMKWNTADQISRRFVKPTGENKKLIFITERL